MGSVIVVGLGPAGPELITNETAQLLNGDAPVLVRTARHPAADNISYTASFDHLYETHETFEAVYEAIVDALVSLASEHGEVVYAVPGSPVVAEHTVELLRADERVDVVVKPALSFAELAWVALGIDLMTEAVTIVDAHRFVEDAAGRLGPMLVTQVHSAEVLEEVILELDDIAPETVTILQGLGTTAERVAAVPFAELGAALEPDHLTSLWIPRLAEPVAASFVRFDELVRRLRSECPWDQKQTHGSLRPFLIEEAYEVLESIDAVVDDPDVGYPDLEEELGDLLFQIFFHSRLAAEEGRFTVADVADGIHDKLHSRHPHVFGDADADATVANWEQAKKAEKQRDSVLDGIPAALPALLHALKTQKRAATTGFSGPDLDWALADVADELQEVTEDPSEAEIGDLLFAAVQVARMQSVDPETALRGATGRFAARFRVVEATATARAIDLTTADMDTLTSLWREAKASVG